MENIIIDSNKDLVDSLINNKWQLIKDCDENRLRCILKDYLIIRKDLIK